MKIDFKGKEFTVACKHSPFDEEDHVRVKLRLIEVSPKVDQGVDEVVDLRGVLLKFNPEHLPHVSYGHKYPVITIGDLRNVNSDIDLDQIKAFADDQFKRGMSEAEIMISQMQESYKKDSTAFEILQMVANLLNDRINQ